MTRHWVVFPWVLAAVSLMGNVWQGYREFHRQRFDIMHNVRVLERSDDFNFKMAVEDPDTHQLNEFGVRFCPDYKPTVEMQAGTTLTYLKYERRDLDNCWEIAPHNLGYGLLKDPHNELIRFDTR